MPGERLISTPAENEFSELMRSLLAWTGNEVNHTEQDFVGWEGIDRNIILPQTGRAVGADCTAAIGSHARSDGCFQQITREGKSHFSCSLFLQASVAISRSRRALQDHCTGLLIGSQTAERLWRFVDSCISSLFQRRGGAERSKPICDRSGHLKNRHGPV